jgi:hypothetical protein
MRTGYERPGKVKTSKTERVVAGKSTSIRLPVQRRTVPDNLPKAETACGEAALCRFEWNPMEFPDSEEITIVQNPSSMPIHVLAEALAALTGSGLLEVFLVLSAGKALYHLRKMTSYARPAAPDPSSVT